MRAYISRSRLILSGGISGYPLATIYEEVAFIAYHFHWSHEEIMNMEHRERQRWCEEISRINRRLSEKNREVFLKLNNGGNGWLMVNRRITKLIKK